MPDQAPTTQVPTPPTPTPQTPSSPLPPHFHKEDKISEADLIPDGRTIAVVPDYPAREGTEVTYLNGSDVRRYKMVDGEWHSWSLDGSNPNSTPRHQISTVFEAVQRFGVLENNLPSIGATTNGLDLFCNLTGGSYVIMEMGNPSSTQEIFSRNPTFLAQAFCSNPATAGLGTVYMGVGEIGEFSNVLAFGVSQQFGFKFIANGSSDYNIYATCSDGTGETSTFIAANGNTAHVYRIVMTSGSKIEYYVDGTLVATHTAHLPFVDENFFTFASSNSNQNGDAPRILVQYATLELDQY